MATFWWFPPLSVLTGSSTSCIRTLILVTTSAMTLSSARVAETRRRCLLHLATNMSLAGNRPPRRGRPGPVRTTGSDYDVRNVRRPLQAATTKQPCLRRTPRQLARRTLKAGNGSIVSGLAFPRPLQFVTHVDAESAEVAHFQLHHVSVHAGVQATVVGNQSEPPTTARRGPVAPQDRRDAAHEERVMR
jgi:hypothetical protein